MKKIFSLLCCVILAAVGCTQVKKASDQIEIWHWMTDRQEVLEELAKKYEAETGIKIKFEVFAPSDEYTKKIIAAAQANVLPDIYGILDKKSIVASFIKAGFVADLSEDFQADGGAWEKAMFSKALDVNRFKDGNGYDIKPGIYGVPLDVGSEQMIYNRRLLQRAGIMKVPATFDEWLLAIKKLKRVGVTPFVTGFGELWIVDCFASNYAFNIMGEQKVLDTYRGIVKYTDADWIKVFTIFETLRDSGAFSAGIVVKGNKIAEQDFALERAAFAFNGAWAVNVYKGMKADLDYGVAPLPAMDPSVEMVSWGGAESSLVVNAASSNKDKAIAFLKWLTAREQQVFLSEQLNILPANRDALADIPKNLSDFARAMESSTHPKIWPVNEDSLVLDVYRKGIQSIIIAEATPERVAADVQKAKERQMDKLKK